MYVHTYNEAKVYGNTIGLLTEQLDTSAKISMFFDKMEFKIPFF